MRWRGPLIYTGLLLAWVAFAAWQYREYRHERELARAILEGQSRSVMNALVGGIRSHRRLGRFFQDQLQGMLDELVKESEDVLAVAVSSEDGRRILGAGKMGLLEGSPLTGDYWDAAGFRLVERFELSPVPTGTAESGGGPGRGPGRGYGWRWRLDAAEEESPFANGGTFAAMLLLDRTPADAQCRSAAWSRGLVIAAGTLVLVCVALAWQATVRMVEARARTRVLETETRHLRELSQAADPAGVIKELAVLLQPDLEAKDLKFEHNVAKSGRPTWNGTVQAARGRLSQVERATILATLDECNGNRTHAVR